MRTRVISLGWLNLGGGHSGSAQFRAGVNLGVLILGVINWGIALVYSVGFNLGGG